MSEHDEATAVTEGNNIQNSDGQILKIYFKNLGLDQYAFFNFFASEGISSLRKLQELTCDKAKFEQCLSDLPKADVLKLQAEIDKSLQDAVNHERLLTELGLLDYYPEKITLEMVRQRATEKLNTFHDIPWYVLSKILMLDHKGRDDVKPHETEIKSCESKKEPDKAAELEDTLFASLKSSHHEFHPLDVIVVVLRCSTNFLRQIFCEKLFLCKLSIPLVLPPFLNNKSMLLIWALRSIMLSGKDSNSKYFEMSCVTISTVIISFVKFEKVRRSKSKFLNEVLNGQSHNTFFHIDCKNGMAERILSKQLIEVSWHIPSSNSTKEISRLAALINHRGDGRVIETNNNLLLKSSNIIFVMVDLSEITEPHIVSSLKSMSSCGADLILMLSKDLHTKFGKKCKDDIKYISKELESKQFSVENIIFDFTANGEKNVKDLQEESINKINKLLVKLKQGFCLESLKDIVENSTNITTDERVKECTESLDKVKQLMLRLENETSINVKEKILPLQCTPLQEWAKLTKEEHRLKYIKPEDNLEEYVNRILETKCELRAKQREIYRSKNIFLELVLKELSENKITSPEMKYYLKWLKLHFDEISRKTIPQLQSEYSAKWNEIYQLRDKCPDNLKQEMNAMETQISETSLGLEHILREIAQLYEAYSHLDSDLVLNDKENLLVNSLESLPRIAAELLLDGYPIELMDGDASCIPLAWTKAIFLKLGALIGKKKKIFILSVLGLQSSGKSTLLNTMFCLQFAVAAGRCTRGVYAHLISIQKGVTRSECDYDYILIVDSEGVKAAELGREKLEHDNEIATFVIGFGDITLINVKGESVSEMEDVLQIVVNALMKMNLGKYSLSLHPSCVFIHQNVAAANASQKLKSGQQKFIESMNRVAKAASEQQNSSEFTTFKQVINFDISKHIFYVPDLWKGDPPMAPINQGYSERINYVKNTLLTEIMMQNWPNDSKNFSTALDINMKLDRLWKGILDQNYVFSFRNSLALREYNIIESNVSRMRCDLRDYGVDILNKFQEEENVKKELKKKYDAIHRELTEFFDQNQETNIYEQWRNNSLWKLKETYNETLNKTIDRLNKYLKKQAKEI